MRYYIADCHFYHESMNNYMDKRGFSCKEEMNQYMINQWNKRVNKNDEVVIIGDFSVEKSEETEKILKILKGQKYLIIGNHDKYLKEKSFDRDLFKKIDTYIEINDNKKKIILCHYPIFCYNGQYRIDKDGNPISYMLHGHVHDTYDQVLVDNFTNETINTMRKINGNKTAIPCNIMNCFSKWSDYTPWTLEEWETFHKARIKDGFPLLQPPF